MRLKAWPLGPWLGKRARSSARSETSSGRLNQSVVASVSEVVGERHKPWEVDGSGMMAGCLLVSVCVSLFVG